MFKLLVILLVIKLYDQVNIFRHFKKMHGQDIIHVARKLEVLINKHTKIQLVINFMKTCKMEDLMPTFANVNVLIKHGLIKLKVKIAGALMEAEIKINMIKKED